MSWLASLFGKDQAQQKVEPTSFILRQGKYVPVGDAFSAWTSGDINEMLEAESTKTNSVDRHYFLQSIVGEAYKLRKDEKYKQLCIEYADKHLREFPSIVQVLKDEVGGILPRVTIFQHYAIVLAENGEYGKAIKVCKQAIEYGLYDNTKSGFEGRITRIKKMAEKEKA